MKARYVYGIVRPELGRRLSIEGGGLSGEPVSMVQTDGIAALVSPFDGERVRSSSANLWAHQRVVEEARMAGTVLPVRFGTVMPDEGAVVRDLLEPRQSELALVLAELAQKVEMRVKCTYLPDVALREAVDSSPAIRRIQAKIKNRPEAATLHARIQLGELAAAALEDIKERDARMVVDHLSRNAPTGKMLTAPADDVVVHLAFLLDEGEVGSLNQAVDDIAAVQEGRLRFELIGPLAPWDFVDLGGVSAARGEIRPGGR